MSPVPDPMAWKLDNIQRCEIIQMCTPSFHFPNTDDQRLSDGVLMTKGETVAACPQVPLHPEPSCLEVIQKTLQ